MSSRTARAASHYSSRCSRSDRRPRCSMPPGSSRRPMLWAGPCSTDAPKRELLQHRVQLALLLEIVQVVRSADVVVADEDLGHGTEASTLLQGDARLVV